MIAIDIGVIQFPGSNTERETSMALKRAGMNPVDFLWNQHKEKLLNCNGYVITGGFSYEDRSRAGVIASLDPIMSALKKEALKGKPILGICNGAQILVESGMVPGLIDGKIGIALTDNKRVKNGRVVGTGYYNDWAYLKMSVKPEQTAFTRHLKQWELIHIPFAHAEGRFILPNELLKKLLKNGQVVFRYCGQNGDISAEFPTNPNGSDYNIAAVSNPNGNVMAIMPHPERTHLGDAIFTSMKEYISSGHPIIPANLSHELPNYEINDFKLKTNASEWVIDMIITDNEAASVQNALVNLDLKVDITRQVHWEIVTTGNADDVLKKIESSGELFNSNKEYISEINKNESTVSFLVRQKEDMQSLLKLESLTGRFGIDGIVDLKRGVIWNVVIKDSNFRSSINDILDTNIFFNQLSHECYRIS